MQLHAPIHSSILVTKPFTWIFIEKLTNVTSNASRDSSEDVKKEEHHLVVPLMLQVNM